MLNVVFDTIPEAVDLALEIVDLVCRGIQRDHLPRTEIHELHTRGENLRTCEQKSIEAHLIESLSYVTRSGGLSCLVVDDAQPSVRSLINAVDKAEQTYTALGRRGDPLLARCWGDPLGLLDREIAVDERAGIIKPRLSVGIVCKERGNLGVLGCECLVLRLHLRVGILRCPIGWIEGEELLEHRVDDRTQGFRASLRLPIPV